MNPSPLRKLLSSKLFLFGILAFLLSFAAKQALIYFSVDYVLTPSDFQQLLPDADPESLQSVISMTLLLTEIFSFLLSAGISLPLMLGSFLVYSNARRNQPWKTAGFTLIKAYCVIYVAVSSFSFATEFLGFRSNIYYSIATLIEVTVNLVMAVMGLQTAKTAQEYARYGFTPRRISPAFPVVILISLCVQTGELILTVLTNLLASNLPGAGDYLISSRPLFFATALSYLTGIISLALYFVIAQRLKTAISGREPAKDDEILLN